MSLIKINSVQTFEEAYKNFEAYCKAKNLAPDTLKSYANNKKALMKFMEGNFDLNQISQCMIEQFVVKSQENGNSCNTINTKLKHIRVMINYFAKQGWMARVPINLIRSNQLVKEVYNDKELEILLRKPNVKVCDFDDFRNWVLINYFLATGNRLSSVLNIKIKHVNLDEDEIILVHTKNRKQQIVPIVPTLKTILLEYIRYRQPKSDDDYLFCTWHGQQLTKYGLRNALVRYNQRRGVMRTSIHAYRHTFAKLWILNGGDVFRLQKMLGHKDIRMTRNYVNMFDVDLKDTAEFNPLTKLYRQKVHIKL